MSIQVAWADPQNAILRFTFRGTWSWNELYDALAAGFDLIGSSEQPVALIFDLRATSFLPEDLMSQLKRLCTLHHPNETIRVVVADLPFWRSLFTVCTRLFPSAASTYFLAPTLREAYTLIAERGRHQWAS